MSDTNVGVGVSILNRVWISPGSTTTGSVVDPLCAACEDGFVPTHLVFVTNPSVVDEMNEIADAAQEVVAVHSDTPEVEFKGVDAETDFARHYELIRDEIDKAKSRGDEVAVNMTPGRKYMSGIAMQTGVQEGADHVYYLLIKVPRYYGDEYHNIPSTAVELYDFTEEVR